MRAAARICARLGLCLAVPGLVAVASPAEAQPAAAAPQSSPVSAAPAPALENYRFNARERTARGLAAWEKGRLEDAVAPLDSALRLQPGDPLAEYNAGTAHLGTGQPDAAQLLEEAAKHASPGLAADAFYNLGNARLDAKDAKGAIDAYKNALRAQSDLPAAKRNLELALRMLDEQKRQQEQQKKDQQQNQQDKNQDDQQNQRQNEGQQDDKGQKNDSRDQSKTDPQEQQNPSQPGESGPPQQRPQQNPLPQFQNQKDMTAEQAAAILQAVENLERQQRREQARALARAKTSVEKDW